VVRVRVRTEPVDEEELEEQAEAAEEFLDGLFDLLDLSVDLDHAEADGVMYVDVLAGEESEEDVGLLIGRHGQTLDALQEITRSAVQRQFQSRSRIVVDVEDYRKRRRSQLSRKAKDLARRVRQTGRPERLDPMNPFERKIIHDAAAEIGGVETISEGEDPERRVVIKKRS
jgi:spoIIIJ-associated protein